MFQCSNCCNTGLHSDNVACDLLFELVGGPAALHDDIQSYGYKGDRCGRKMKRRCTPMIRCSIKTGPRLKVSEILKKFEQKTQPSETSQALLWKWMVETTTGPERLKGLLPAGTVVAHKTGTSGIKAGKLRPLMI